MKKSIFLHCLGIFAVTFLLFRGVLDNGFVNWDDPMYVTENPGIQSLDGAHVWNFFTSFEAGGYAPLSRLSLALDWAFWGNNPRGFHLTALILHCLNACLVFLIARKLYSFRISHSALPAPPSGFIPHPSSLIPSLLASLLFSLHPLRVESVAWISERRDVLSGFFGLACILTWLRYFDSKNQPSGNINLQPLAFSRSPFFWYLFSFFFFICALLSKGSLVTLPLALILLDIYLTRLNPSVNSIQIPGLKALSWSLPFLLVSFYVGMNTLFAVQVSDLAHSSQAVGWEPRLAQSLVANLLYLFKWAAPMGLNPLNPLHSLYHFNQFLVWWGLLVSGGITGILVIYRKQFPGTWTAWWAYLIMILPFLGIAESGLQLTADRYTYFSMIPFCLLAGGAFQWALGKFSCPPTSVLCSLAPIPHLLWFAWLTPNQILFWKDSESLWSHSLKRDPRNLTALLNLCDALESRNEGELCIPLYHQILQLDPHNAEIWNHLGIAFEGERKFSEAGEAYQEALRINPSHLGARNNLGKVLLEEGGIFQGLTQMEMAWKFSHSPEMESNLEGALEFALNQPKLSGQDLDMAQQILLELDRRSGGQNQNLKNLKTKLGKRKKEGQAGM